MKGAHYNLDASSDEMFTKAGNGVESPNKQNSTDKADVEALVIEKNAKTEIVNPKNNLLRVVLILVILALLIAVICLAALLAKSRRDEEAVKSSSKRSTRRSDNVCLTPGCIAVASRVIKNANFSVDPCNDFYEYSCGGWKHSNFLPDSSSELNGFTVLKEKAANIIKRELDTRKTSSVKNSATNKLLSFFHSCLDEETLENKGAKPLLNLLRSQGSWPLLNTSWNGESWNLTNALVRNHDLFFSFFHNGRPAPIFNTCVKVDDGNSSEHIISIDEPQFHLVPYLYESNMTKWNQLRGAYGEKIKEYVRLLGGNSSSSDVTELLDFAMNVANASTPTAVFRDVLKTYRRIPLSKFIEETGDSIDWLSYLTEIFSPHGKKISLKTNIATRSLDYLKKVNQMFKTATKRTISNYLNWIVVQKYAPNLSAAFRNADFKFRQALSGVKKDSAHWLQCFKVVQDNMDMAVARVFVDATFDNRTKDVATEIVRGFKKEFIKVVRASKWMGSKTKLEAEAKAENMINDIGYPDFVTDDVKLNKYYEDLSVFPDEYFKTLSHSYQLRRKHNLALIKMPVNKRQWDIPPTDVNAYYDVANNKMVFLAGLMDTPFFEVNGPMAVKYASFGFVVGHETTHGFDDQGRLYDKNGDLKLWWSKDSEKNFKQRAKCIEDQFAAYKLGDLYVNAKQTLGENIADLGGIEVAYLAYKQWEKENGGDLQLPGVKLTSDQLFFLANGQVWCALYNEQKGRETILQDPHSPPNLRVMGLSNLEAFVKAFSCPANSKMNRKDKCKLWV